MCSKTSTSVLWTRRRSLVYAYDKPHLRARADPCVAHYGTRSLQQAVDAPVYAMLQAVCCQYTAQYRERLILKA